MTRAWKFATLLLLGFYITGFAGAKIEDGAQFWLVAMLLGIVLLGIGGIGFAVNLPAHLASMRKELKRSKRK